MSKTGIKRNQEVVDAGRSGDSLQLQGRNAFEAAFHCAAVTAALREKQKHVPASTQT